MSHDNTLAIAASTESLFHFIHTDGDGKVKHSRHYQTEDENGLYEAQEHLCHHGENITNDEAKALRKKIIKDLAAKPYN